MNVGGDI